MAITNNQIPQLVSPVYSPMFFLNSSAYATETNFRYIYEVYTTDGLIVTKKMLPFPNYFGRIDASAFLKNEVSYDLNCTKTGITDTLNSLIQYEVKVGHTGSTHTTSPVSAGGIMYGFNGVDTNLNFDFNNYIMSGTTSSFLTNQPLVTDVYLSDYYTLSFLNGYFSGTTGTYTSSVKYINIKVYSGSTNTTYQITNPDYLYIPTEGDFDDHPEKMYKTVGVGPANLTSYIDSNTIYYEVWATNNGGSIMSKVYRFNVNHYEPRYSKNQVCFLNRLGNFSYFTFTMKELETTKMENSTFTKNRYELNTTTNKWETHSYNRGTTVFANTYTKEYTLTSDWIEQSTFDFMEELFTSPEVYMINGGNYIPVIITDTSFVNKKVKNDKLINFSIKCELSNKNKSNI